MNTPVKSVLDPIAAELTEFERRLEETVAGDTGLMSEAMGHIVRAGGKRLRPALVILSGSLGDASPDHIYNLAMGVEFIHTATLIHDDLIDHSDTRRGLATIHAMLGVNPAIIVGDYYFARGANLMSSIGIPMVDEVISRTVMIICMGELLQMTSKLNLEQSVDDYHRKIESKTAALLSASCYCGGIIAHLPEDRCEALQRYGFHLGMAFQIADDLLDYTASAAEVGKPVGADLRQGTVTLPLMCALRDASVGPRLREVLQRRTLRDEDYAEIVGLVRSSTGVHEAERQAQLFAERAAAELESFAPSVPLATLRAVCDYVVERRI